MFGQSNSAEVVDLDDHRRVWMNTLARCACGKEVVATVHVDADLDTLECSGCGNMTSQATHVLGEDGEWVPRFAIVIPIRKTNDGAA